MMSSFFRFRTEVEVIAALEGGLMLLLTNGVCFPFKVLYEVLDKTPENFCIRDNGVTLREVISSVSVYHDITIIFEYTALDFIPPVVVSRTYLLITSDDLIFYSREWWKLDTSTGKLSRAYSQYASRNASKAELEEGDPVIRRINKKETVIYNYLTKVSKIKLTDVVFKFIERLDEGVLVEVYSVNAKYVRSGYFLSISKTLLNEV